MGYIMIKMLNCAPKAWTSLQWYQDIGYKQNEYHYLTFDKKNGHIIQLSNFEFSLTKSLIEIHTGLRNFWQTIHFFGYKVKNYPCKKRHDVSVW